MMIALNAAYDVKSRPVWKRFSLSILYTLGIALLLLVAAGLMVTGPQVIAWIAGLVGLEQYLVTLWTWLRWPLAVFLLMLAVALFYYLVPDVEQRFRFITPGSVLSVIAWIAASLAWRLREELRQLQRHVRQHRGDHHPPAVLLPVGGSGAVRRRAERGDRHHSGGSGTLASANFRTTTTPNSRKRGKSASLTRPCRWRAGTDTARGPGGPACAAADSGPAGQRRIAHLIVEGQYLPHRAHLAQAAGFQAGGAP